MTSIPLKILLGSFAFISGTTALAVGILGKKEDEGNVSVELAASKVEEEVKEVTVTQPTETTKPKSRYKPTCLVHVTTEPTWTWWMFSWWPSVSKVRENGENDDFLGEQVERGLWRFVYGVREGCKKHKKVYVYWDTKKEKWIYSEDLQQTDWLSQENVIKVKDGSGKLS